MGYFDELTIDRTQEVPPGDLEIQRRLLYMFKLAINGNMVMLADEEQNVISLSSEFLDNFDWTLEEFQALEPADFFHADSLNVALTNRANHSAALYMARCYKKGGTLNWYEVNAMCVAFDEQHWRLLSFTKV